MEGVFDYLAVMCKESLSVQHPPLGGGLDRFYLMLGEVEVEAWKGFLFIFFDVFA